ncbi:MAG: glycosyltransferase family 9 protein [Deltaproteobacteria bacterium]|nr:glycosyltransferase family 9 protein [Deltaproteobacteria bacterium]
MIFLFSSLKRIIYYTIEITGSVVCTFLRWVGLISQVPQFDKSMVKSILVVRLDRIGDLVLSTPTFKAIREHFPKAKIVLLVSLYTKDIVEGNPYIDELITIDKKIGVVKKLRLIREIRDKKFDLSIALSYCFLSIMATFLSGARFRVGIDNYGLGFIFTSKISYLQKDSDNKHEVESTLDVVRTIGIDTKNKALYVPIDKKGELLMGEFFNNNSLSIADFIVAIHPGARVKNRRWEPDGFAEVADYLINKYNARIILIGGAEEIDLCQKVKNFMSNNPIITTGSLSLVQLISLLEKSRLFIGNSTGPLHIAAAFGVPTIAIFNWVAPIDSPLKWFPWGNLHIVLYKNKYFSANIPRSEALYWKEFLSTNDFLNAIDAITNKLNIEKIK